MVGVYSLDDGFADSVRLVVKGLLRIRLSSWNRESVILFDPFSSCHRNQETDSLIIENHLCFRVKHLRKGTLQDIRK
jgi:hypothetical protein